MKSGSLTKQLWIFGLLLLTLYGVTRWQNNRAQHRANDLEIPSSVDYYNGSEIARLLPQRQWTASAISPADYRVIALLELRETGRTAQVLNRYEYESVPGKEQEEILALSINPMKNDLSESENIQLLCTTNAEKHSQIIANPFKGASTFGFSEQPTAKFLHSKIQSTRYLMDATWNSSESEGATGQTRRAGLVLHFKIERR